MDTQPRRLPPAGLILFLGYAFVILGAIGVSLRWVVDQAIGAPLSIPGIVVMVLLAYTIFTITMVLQRKQAARGLALGLSTLTIPAVPLLLLGPVPVIALVPAVLAVLLFVGLRRPTVKAWLTEE
jgi:FtsH-binding integral membrane protein